MLTKITCLIDGKYVDIISMEPDGAHMNVSFIDDSQKVQTKAFMYNYETGLLTISDIAIAE